MVPPVSACGPAPETPVYVEAISDYANYTEQHLPARVCDASESLPPLPPLSADPSGNRSDSFGGTENPTKKYTNTSRMLYQFPDTGVKM